MHPRWKQCTQLLSVLEVDGRESSHRVPSSGRLHERWWLPDCTAHRTLQLKCSTGWCTRLACSVSNQTRISMDRRLHCLSPSTTTASHQGMMKTRQTTWALGQGKGGAPDGVIPVPRIRRPAEGVADCGEIRHIDVQDVGALYRRQATFSKAGGASM
jgi:hypothetical protein